MAEWMKQMLNWKKRDDKDIRGMGDAKRNERARMKRVLCMEGCRKGARRWRGCQDVASSGGWGEEVECSKNS